MNANLSKLFGTVLAGSMLTFGGMANAKTPTIGSATEFATKSPDGDPEGVAVGIGGLVWYTEQNYDKIAVALPAGKIQAEYTVPTSGAGVSALTQGSDLAFWFTETNVGQIGRVDLLGNVTEYPVSSSSNVPLEIALGSDGNIWFTELIGGLIGTIDTTGTVTEYAPPTGFSLPVGICAGPDGNLWFVEQGNNADGNFNIGQITTAGVITEYDVGANAGVFITAGPDGNLWYTEQTASNIAKFDITTHTVTEYAVPSGSGLQGITAGADGNLWFVESDSSAVGRITTKGVITEYSLPTADSNPGAIAPAHTLLSSLRPYVYVTEAGSGKIARVYTGSKK